MSTVRDFLVTFSVTAGILMGLVSFVFLGSALMDEFVTVTDLGGELIASAILSVLLAIPMAAVGTRSGQFDFVGASAT